jgi:hypothetical protein
VAEAGAGVSNRAGVKVGEDFGCGSEVEGAGEALGGQGVVEEGGELAVERDGEEEGETEAEGVGPEDGGEAAEGDPKAVEEDVAAFRHLVLSVTVFRREKADPLRG